MTREEMINKLMAAANDLVDNYTADKYDELIDTALDWNSKHYGTSEEIFVCDIYEEDGYEGDGIMIEDDYFIIQED